LNTRFHLSVSYYNIKNKSQKYKYKFYYIGISDSNLDLMIKSWKFYTAYIYYCLLYWNLNNMKICNSCIPISPITLYGTCGTSLLSYNSYNL